MNVAQLIAIALGLVAAHVAAFLFALNPGMTNGFFFGAFSARSTAAYHARICADLA